MIQKTGPGSIRKQECPTCHKELDAATQVDGENQPKQGDLSICFYCGQLLVFDSQEPFRYHILTQAEKDEMEPELLAKLEYWQAGVLLKSRLEALTWIDTLGTEHCILDCDCVVCESYRDGTLDWSKAPRKSRI